MKRYRGSDGKERLWIEPEEIEATMERELRKSEFYPDCSAPAVDIEGFVEQYLRVAFDDHAVLPADVLGVTEFYSDRNPKIFINRDLTEEAMDVEDSPTWLKGRWRATMAHEAAHVIFHRGLFQANQAQMRLLAMEAPRADGQPQRCLKRDVAFGGRCSDWREVQANMGMAALLMPKRLFCEICAEERSAERLHGKIGKGTIDALHLASRLGSRFHVSTQAALIRLETVGVLCLDAQGTMG
jgi:hypothetical protein